MLSSVKILIMSFYSIMCDFLTYENSVYLMALHEKNDFAELSQNLIRDLNIILFENNYVERSN